MGPDSEIILVDNGSTDNTTGQIPICYPQVRILRSDSNLGFARGCNLGARYGRGRYLAFLNPDTEVASGWLDALTAVLEEDPRAGLATSKILLLAQKDRLNTAGNDIHLTGLTLCRGIGSPEDALDEKSRVAAVSGAAFAIRRDLFEALGGFDPSFFLYMEDTDLSIRARLAGYNCLYAPDSIVYHDYTLQFGPDKIYYQERNRYLVLLKLFSWPTLLLLMPALLLAEVVTWGYVLLGDRAHWTNKLRAYGYLLKEWRQILVTRRQVQALRRVPDHQLLASTTARLDYGQTGATWASRGARLIFDPLFHLWRAFLLLAVRW
jgi:GT2 family glycosyltransferase